MIGRSSFWKLVGGTAALATFVIAVVFQLWRADLRVPLAYHEDAMSHAMVVKSVMEHGWYYNNASLGAPFGQALYDFPIGGEHLQIGLLKILGLIFGDVFLTVNIYYLLTFVLVAVSAALFLRWLSVRPGTAIIFGTLYAFLPYHFARGSRHLFLSGYYLVPLGVYLVLAVLLGHPLFERRDSSAKSFIISYASRRSALTLLACALIGSTSTYFTCFTALLIAVAAGARALSKRSLILVVPAIAIALSLLCTLAVQNIPVKLYAARHGANAQVAGRYPWESEIYGLRIAQLILPAEGHRVETFNELTERYQSAMPYRTGGERGQSLGFFGLFGLIFLLWFAAKRLLGAEESPSDSPLFGPMAFLAVAGIAVATVGGTSTLFSTFITSTIRCWNRMSIIVALLTLATVALVVDSARSRWELRTARRGPIVLGLCAVLLFGLLDQVPGAAALPNQKELAAEYASDRNFVAAIEAELPHGAMVFQMPYQPFPEGGKLERAFDTDHLKGYLNSHDLRWSFGGMKGRETDWQEDLRGQPVELVVTRLLAVGFRGIWIDRFAYADGGDTVEFALTSLLHSPDIVSQDGRLSFFSLMDAPSDLNVQSPSNRHALAESTLHPVRHRWEAGFNQVTQESDDWWLDAAPTAEVGLYNPSESPRKLVVDFTLQTRGPRTQIVHVTYPGGVERLEVTSAGTGMHRVITVPSGRTTIKFQLESKASAGTEGEPLRLLRPAIYEAQIS